MPTPEQILAAIQNHRRPPRTPGARLRDAVEHVNQPHIEKPRPVTSRTGALEFVDASDKTKFSPIGP